MGKSPNKAIINFLEDEYNEQQVVTVIQQVISDSNTDENAAFLSSLIAQGLSYLEHVGVPPEKERTITLKSLEGNPITLANIVKDLKSAPPLLEFRANSKDYGAFRAIFFYINKNDKHYIYFTKAMVKQESKPAAFETLILESLNMLQEFLRPE